MQQMIEQLNSITRDNPASAIHNLKQIAKDLLEEEREMVADAWRKGNREGWAMSTDWPEDGERYYDENFL